MVGEIRKFIDDDYRIELDKMVNICFAIYMFCGHICNHTVVFKIISIIFAFFELMYISKKRKMYISSYIVLYLFFILFCVLQCNIGISINNDTSYGMIKTLIVDVLLNFLVINYLFFEDNILNFIKIYSTTGFLYCLYMLLTNITKLGSVRLGSGQYVLFSQKEAYYQPNGVGFILAYAFVMYMYRILVCKEKKCIIPTCICAMGGFLTGSRKALLIIVIGCFFMLLVFYKGKYKVKILVISVITVSIMAWVVIKVPAFYNTVGVRMKEFLQGSRTGNMTEASADTRQRLIELAKNLYRQKPMCGWGLDCFKLFKGSYGLYAHNNFWELLADTGIVGFGIFYLAYLLGFIYLFIGFIKKDEMSKLGLVCFITYVVMEYGIVSYYDRMFQIIIMFCIVIGTKMMIKLRKEKKCQA